MERGAGAEYVPRESASLLKYAPRESVGRSGKCLLPPKYCPSQARVRRGIRATWGVGVAGSATSLLNTAPPRRGLGVEYAPLEGASLSNYRLPPSAGCPPLWRGLGTQTHKNTHKEDVCRCALCAQLCDVFGVKTHVVCRDYKEF